MAFYLILFGGDHTLFSAVVMCVVSGFQGSGATLKGQRSSGMVLKESDIAHYFYVKQTVGYTVKTIQYMVKQNKRTITS